MKKDPEGIWNSLVLTFETWRQSNQELGDSHRDLVESRRVIVESSKIDTLTLTGEVEELTTEVN